MFKKLFASALFSLTVISGFLSAEIEYKISDIDTLQTHSSGSVALNNQGQILGWYNIDGSPTGKHFFIRNRNGEFHELPIKTPDAGLAIEWKYLKEDSKAYGTFAVNQATTALCMWDHVNGFVKLGVMPGKDIVAINNAGQVLIKSVQENENGRVVTRPVIWHNNKITKLNGLEGDLGIASEESFGFDMNNKGEVVGQSVSHMIYKNNVYKQVHATKWVNGKAIDIHGKIPKTISATAFAINDFGDIFINNNENNEKYLVKNNGTASLFSYDINKLSDASHVYNDKIVKSDKGDVLYLYRAVNSKIENDFTTIWIKVNRIVSVNYGGEIIAEGETVYGENHAMFLTPAKPE